MLLTDEEIISSQEYPGNSIIKMGCDYCEYFEVHNTPRCELCKERWIAKAQHKKTVEWFIEEIGKLRGLMYFKTEKIQATYTQNPTNTTSHFIDKEAIDAIVQAIKDKAREV